VPAAFMLANLMRVARATYDAAAAELVLHCEPAIRNSLRLPFDSGHWPELRPEEADDA
jgi:hypothetical protein